jgi:heptosyltransferase-2
MTTRILIIGPSWVGDMVMSQTLLKLLKQQHPDCIIDVLAPAWSLPILARMPEVHRGIVLPFGHGDLKLVDRYRFGKQLRGQYGQAIVLPNSLKSALVPFHANIPLRTGWRGEMRYLLLNDVRSLDESQLPLMVQRFAALAYPPRTILPTQLPHPQLTTSAESLQQVQQKYRLGKQGKALVLCPGAEFGNAKQWPEEHYAAVANAKLREGWQVWILGSRNDEQTAGGIVRLLDKPLRNHCHNLAGRTQLVETIDILALADAVVTNDSGLMHIAAAVNTPLVVVYGSTSPDFTPPLGDKVAIVKSAIACAPCFERTCPLGHRKCLTEQQPATILKALDGLIAA